MPEGRVNVAGYELNIETENSNKTKEEHPQGLCRWAKNSMGNEDAYYAKRRREVT